MTYKLGFKESALKEWRKLDGSLREQFKKKLAEGLEGPRVKSAKLSAVPDWMLLESSKQESGCSKPSKWLL